MFQVGPNVLLAGRRIETHDLMMLIAMMPDLFFWLVKLAGFTL